MLNKNWAKRFPGASWVPVFAELAKEKGLEVVSGDIALSNVQAGYWNAEDILVIQELDALHGRKLILLGAKPVILTGFESPIIAYLFYDRLPQIAPVFQNRILFSGAFRTFKASSGYNIPLCIPSFNSEDIVSLMPWNERKFMVMVAANKYWKDPFRLIYLFNPRRSAILLFRELRKWRSPTRSLVTKVLLHDKRLEAIEFFAQLNHIDLFGYGWDKLQNLPSAWQKRLKTIIKNLNPKPCSDKTKTISGYKFAVCFENNSYLGHIDEKIIDCFVAGVIPIYLGAPDVGDFIPKEAFVDMRGFSSWRELNNYLEGIKEGEALKMISAGRDFLKSAQGRLYSYAGFGQFIMDILTKGGYINGAK